MSESKGQEHEEAVLQHRSTVCTGQSTAAKVLGNGASRDGAVTHHLDLAVVANAMVQMHVYRSLVEIPRSFRPPSHIHAAMLGRTHPGRL